MRKILLIAVVAAVAMGIAHADVTRSQSAQSLVQNPQMKQAMLETNVLSGSEMQMVDMMANVDATGVANLRAMGISVGTNVAGCATLRVPIDRIDEVMKVEGVQALQLARPMTLMLDSARAAGFVDWAHQGKDLDSTYNGRGVIVGVIDNGFQYSHTAFRDWQTSGCRITRIWEQRLDSTETFRPDGFDYGCEFSPEKAQLTDTHWYDLYSTAHGTHVTNIAAGGDTRSSSPYYGVAHKSEIVLVSTKGTESSIVDGAKYIFAYADKVHKPCVINISMGSNIGPHDGTSAGDRMLDALQGPGRLIVGAAGNSNGDKVHIGKTFSIRDRSINTALKFNSYGKTFVGYCDVWGTPSKKYKMRVYIYDKTDSKELAAMEDIDPTVTDYKTVTWKGVPSGKTDSCTIVFGVETGINSTNGKPETYIIAAAQNADKARHFIGITIEAASGTVDMWCDGSYSSFNNMGYPEFSTGDNQYSICEIGGTGKEIISVGAFNSKNKYTNLAGSSYDYSAYYPIGDISSYSSVGPTVDGRVKPEVAAPGTVVVSAYNRQYVTATATNTSMIWSTYYNTKTDYYGTMSGTSMAAPFVTGVMALWLQADSTLSPERAKQVIQETATNDAHTGDIRSVGDGQWGYGKINAYAGLKKLIAKAIKGDVNGDGKVDTTDLSALMTVILNNGTATDNPTADVNEDGEVNSTDISALMTIILG